MKCREVVRYKQRLDHLFREADSFKNDLELHAHWAKYLCVLVSGFLEVSLREIYSDYARRKSAPHFASFVKQTLRGFNNARAEKVFELARSFSVEWAEELRDLLDDQHTSALDSVVNNRHSIVHGRTSNVSYAQVKEWYDSAVEMVDALEMQCGL